MPSLPIAHFEISAARIADLPAADLPEVAFAGRSNAGKSSAINVLVGHKGLAFVSKTPGRTQLINFFRCGNLGFLVDLPGYGYAQVPLEVRREWQALLEHYLTRRPSLVGLILIMDVRHPLTPLDRQMLDWLMPTGRPVHVLLTKADKLSRGAAAAVLTQVRRNLAGYGVPVTAQLFSSLKQAGLEEALQTIAVWMGASGPTKEMPPAKGDESRGRNALV